jgi:glycosyltransferase involved in cell wall biosynthesis
MNDEKVSVIIPVYNSEKFLKSSIDSVLRQSYENLEIIAIDDGSTDSSFEILEQFGNEIIVLRQENKGLADALNHGIKKMSGTWFKWFSPDDVLYPEAIQTLVDNLKKLPANTIVYSNWEIIDEKNTKLRDFSETNYNDLDNFEFNIRLLDDQHINVNTALIPASLFQQGCTFQFLDDPIVIDYDFFLRAGILFGTRFHLVPKTLLQYRIHTTQLSHKNVSQTLESREKVRNEILSQLESSEKQRYHEELNDFKKKKPLGKKTMEVGLKIAKNSLPEWVTDRLLVFYLNKIRSSR